MPLPVWPVDVPHAPALDGVSVDEHARALLETEMEGGNVRARRKVTARIARLSYRLAPLTLAEYASFKTFLFDTLGDGASEFTMPVWDLTGCTDRTVRIVGGAHAVRAVRTGTKISVSFTLDVRDL